MGDTHQQIVKVWIEPGCIVCDACETECPEVFDVQEETCVIKPDAQSADFTKSLTPSIQEASDACPVEVIKFDTVEVEGEAPWAGKEAEAAAVGASAGSSGGAGGKPAPVIPSGPPLPKWARLLRRSTISDRGHSASDLLPAKVPLKVLADALPADAPPDAQAAAMIGTGLLRPGQTMAQRIREEAGLISRREVGVAAGISTIALLAWAMIAGAGATVGGALQSFMVPKVSNEPPSIFRAGTLADFAEPGVYEQHKASQKVWIIYLPSSQLVALSTICTHLGCIPNWQANDVKFKCPCHGSGFQMTGVNFEGPAPRPLERYKIYVEDGYVTVDKSKKYRQELGQWDSAEAFVAV